jgi:hypothetical protein
VANWIGSGTTKPCSVKLLGRRLTEEMIAILRQGDIILDCLPGSQAPRIAEFAKDYELHYANLTEYVAETEKTLAKDATTGFILQTGLTQLHRLTRKRTFQQFCTDFKVDSVTNLELKVGAKTCRCATLLWFYLESGWSSY